MTRYLVTFRCGNLVAFPEPVEAATAEEAVEMVLKRADEDCYEPHRTHTLEDVREMGPDEEWHAQ